MNLPRDGALSRPVPGRAGTDYRPEPVRLVFDRVEVGLRRVRRWIKALRVGYPKTARALIVLAIPACMAALAHLIF